MNHHIDIGEPQCCALRLLNDEKGLEYLEIKGKTSVMVQGGAGLGVGAGKAFGAGAFLPFFASSEVHCYNGMIPEASELDALAIVPSGPGVDKAPSTRNSASHGRMSMMTPA